MAPTKSVPASPGAVQSKTTEQSPVKHSDSGLSTNYGEEMTPQMSRHSNSDETVSPSGSSCPAVSPHAESPGCSPVNSIARRERNKANHPPAIAEEEPLPPGLVSANLAADTLPSRGSGLHTQGECVPCVWYWKPQGCQRGAECGYCHLCPEGEIKNRKRAKLASIRGETDSEDTSPVTSKGPTPMATPGSAKHGTGECRPCMWFYKPQGCQNGAECLHCHLCPEGEIKLRKKSKTDGMKVKKQSSNMTEQSSDSPSAVSPHKVGLIAASVRGPPGLEDTSPTSPAMVSLMTSGSELPMTGAPSVGSVAHGTGDCRPCAWFHKPQGCANGAECRHCHMCPEGEIKARRKAKSGQPSADQADLSPKTPLKLPFPTVQQRRGELPSIGSELHGTDLCRPCAWFHKAGGCENGSECRHCHLCPEGEIQRRRKMKVAQLKKDSKGADIDMQQALWVVQKQQEALLAMSMHAHQVQAMWEAVVAAEVERSPAFDVSSPLGVNPLLAAAASPFGSLGLMSPVVAAAASTAAMAAAATMTASMSMPASASTVIDAPASPPRGSKGAKTPKNFSPTKPQTPSARSPKTIKLSKIL